MMQSKLVVVPLFFAASLNIFVSSCRDVTVNDGEPWYDNYGDDCAWYEKYNCNSGNIFENFGLVANEACCACGGGNRNPTASPSPTTSLHPTSSPTPRPTYWPTYSPWNLDNEDDEVDPTTTVLTLAVLGAFIGLLIIFGCKKECAENSSQSSNNNAARSTNLQTRPTQRTPAIIVDERDIRRQFILKNIIHKKVVTKSSQTNDDTQDDNQECSFTGTSQDNSQSDKIDNIEVIFPHEAIIRERSERIISMRLSLNDEEQAGAIIDKKDDICIETLRSIRSEMNLYLDLERSLDESLYSPRSCPICCEDYVKGDDVAWSKNEECCHAFHTDCIVPWLMDHDDCPMCRCVYVKEGEDEAEC